MNNKYKNGVLVFIKSPETGKIKSRLSTSIDKEIVKSIYKLFVQDLLKNLEKLQYEKIICYHPKNASDEIKKWLGTDYIYLPQTGRNLGERLKNGFIQGFENGFTKLIAIGSDSPDMNIDFFNDAIKNLDSCDTVIGPSIDGGYYLIGFKKNSFYPEVFDDIPWSTEFVYKKSLDSINKANLKVHILPLWHDVDTIEDLFNLYKNNQNTEFKDSQTIEFLSRFFKENLLKKLGDKKFEK